MTLDEIDLRILKELQENARIPNVALADRVGLSPAPCLRRVRALEKAGVIRRYAALVDPAQIGVGLTVFLQASLNVHGPSQLEVFERAVVHRPEVVECYLMTGDADYMLRVAVRDVPAYERFLREALAGLEGVARIKSSFAIRQAKYSTALPLYDLPLPSVRSSQTRKRTPPRRSR